ncbi:MAG: hypothetical protein H0U49_04085 [Parachlamydiaceae bacterium]|nr:hypothetical protein [Parachlamydiaceae bacterium]
MENIAPLTPVNFFQLQCDCHYLPLQAKKPFGLQANNYSKYLLPDTSALTHEVHFAEVALGWNEEGMEIYVSINEPFTRSSYPTLDRGDSFEVCIDTRNIKTSGYNTRFCHHFFCLAEPSDNIHAGEITKFRTEDTHELCDGCDLKVSKTVKKSSYTLQFLIPAHCLFGYDPEQVGMLGFTYRINRAIGSSQHFSVSSDDYQFQQQPSLWASLKLVGRQQ